MTSSHFDTDGNAHMVDVSDKPVTRRAATASAVITMSAAAAAAVRSGQSQKGDVLAVARLAAIQGTKWTPYLIPLCHAISIESVQVEFSWSDQIDWDDSAADKSLTCRVTCSTSGKTGIEMEALTGASIAALTIYDMLKSVDRAMRIGPTALEWKTGGRSGEFHRQNAPRLA